MALEDKDERQAFSNSEVKKKIAQLEEALSTSQKETERLRILLGTYNDRVREIGHEIRSQDNLATENPIFMVQRRRRIYGMDWKYTDDCTWVHEGGGEEIDEEARENLEESWQTNGCTYIYGCHRVGYIDIWENIQPFFTRKGAEEYIRVNGHNLKPETQIYVEAGWRNYEWAVVRALLSGDNRGEPW
jgi:hypothetical protein